MYLLDDISISSPLASRRAIRSEKDKGSTEVALPPEPRKQPKRPVLTYFRKSMKKGGSVKVKAKVKSGMMLWGN